MHPFGCNSPAAHASAVRSPSIAVTCHAHCCVGAALSWCSRYQSVNLLTHNNNRTILSLSQFIPDHAKKDTNLAQSNNLINFVFCRGRNVAAAPALSSISVNYVLIPISTAFPLLRTAYLHHQKSQLISPWPSTNYCSFDSSSTETTMSEITFTPWNPTKLTWFITGASSGFALEIARIALSNGHDVIATSRNPDGKPAIKKEIEALGGRWATLELEDLNSASIIHNLEKQGTHIDVLFNCAGYAFLGPAEIASEEELRKQMDANFFGPSRLVRASVKYMRERRRGIIVNISSGSAVEGRDSMSAYGASKAAMDSKSALLPIELKSCR